MNKFYLNCWVPSLKNYFDIAELKMVQLEILVKYILNGDDNNIEKIFDNIIQDNLIDKSIFSKLTRFDKWFILMFLRATSISSTLHYKIKDVQGNPCAASFSLFDILTDLSEIIIPPIPSLTIDDVTIDFNFSKKLTSSNVFDNIFKITKNQKKYYPQVFNTDKRNRFFDTLASSVLPDVTEHLSLYEQNFKNIFIIKNDKQLKDFYSVKFTMFGNTLYEFLKSIFVPYAQSFYKKKFILLSKLGIDLNSLNDLTPFECDVYINHFNSEKEGIVK